MKAWFFTLLFLASLAPAPARAEDPPLPACACTEKSFDVRYDHADAIFAGTVTGIAPVRAFARNGQSDPPVEVTFAVDEAYKGLGGAKTFTLHTSLANKTCTGYPFRKGAQYLVFAYRRGDFEYRPESLYRFPEGTYDVEGLCGGTKAFSTAAAEDLRRLKPEAPGSFLGRMMKHE
jgi:hypothetical protein